MGSTHGMSRRDFVRLNLQGAALLAAGGASHLACNVRPDRDTGVKVIALGLDGMDPRRVTQMMRDGRLPTFARVARDGYFGPLGTSTPPQSPVAWASFISGCNPGGHGIFDFIHRDPETYMPFLSTSRISPSTRSLKLGNHVIPLGAGRMENLRRGRAFWDILAEHEVPATVFKMPSNFPPSDSRQRTLSGLGTPDLLGTYGMFSFYTDDPFVMLDPDLGGGTVHLVELRQDTLRATIDGPPNSFLEGAPATGVDFTVYRAANCAAARINVAGEELLLYEGEWSDWVHLDFAMAPMISARGMCRFFLKQARPTFKLYVSPLNIDPTDPALPISTPPDYAAELAEAIGPFHTKGLPSDTKALDHGILDEAEFLAQDQAHLEEKTAAFAYELDRFDSGLLFFYVSNVDQRSHMFWRLTDPDHPAYDARLAAEFGATIDKTYEEMDRVLAMALARADRHTRVIALSDHGFHPYSRSFHLNSWLHESGYLQLEAGADKAEMQLLSGVDWTRTRAYAFGFNGICINRAGREGHGIVPASEVRALVEEIAGRLETVTDPMSRQQVVRRAARSCRCYSGPHTHLAPDIVVGYSAGFRCSWQTALGQVPSGLLATNEHKWSGDHLMAAEISPGMLLTSHPIHGQGMALEDVTALILDTFGIPVPDDMDGRAPTPA
jgi:predicted AlkP superfamily phosphohydrolase/phosphomutase